MQQIEPRHPVTPTTIRSLDDIVEIVIHDLDEFVIVDDENDWQPRLPMYPIAFHFEISERQAKTVRRRVLERVSDRDLAEAAR